MLFLIKNTYRYVREILQEQENKFNQNTFEEALFFTLNILSDYSQKQLEQHTIENVVKNVYKSISF